MLSEDLPENFSDLVVQAVMNIEDAIAIFDESLQVVFSNDGGSVLVEHSEEEIAKKIKDFKHSSEDSTPYHHMKRSGRWLRFYIKRLMVAERRYFLFVAEDISDLKLAEQTIAQLAHFDGETGLPNYVLFRDRLNMALFRNRRNDLSSMVAAFELCSRGSTSSIEESTIINMTDELIKGIRKSDTLCRFSRREFLLLAEDLKDRRSASTILRKALDSFENWKAVSGEPSLELNAGFVLLPRDGVDPEQLVNKAFASIQNRVPGK
jgi:GGDEF domain-containing protein